MSDIGLPELHPAQQGLKVLSSANEFDEPGDFQNYIQHNKD